MVQKNFDTIIQDGTVYTPELQNAVSTAGGNTITSLEAGVAGLAFDAKTPDASTLALTIEDVGVFVIDTAYLVDDFAVVSADGTYLAGNFSDALSGTIAAVDLEVAAVSTPETRRKYLLGYI